MTKAIKHAVFWGHFNPPTIAHREIILAALTHYQLDQLFIIINTKEEKQLVSSDHRKSMLQSMFKGNLLAEKMKFLVQTPTHDFDYFKLRERLQKPLAAIVGYDSYSQWHSNQISCSNHGSYDLILVASRQGQKLGPSADGIAELYIDPAVSNISSTQVRALLCQDTHSHQLLHCLDCDVLSYIQHYKLYGQFNTRRPDDELTIAKDLMLHSDKI